MPKPKLKWKEYQLLERHKHKLTNKKKDIVVVKILEYQIDLIGATFYQVYSLN